MDEDKNKNQNQEIEESNVDEKQNKEKDEMSEELKGRLEVTRDETSIGSESIISKLKTKAIIGSIVLCIILLVIGTNIYISKFDNIVFPGITVYGADVSKLNKDELVKKLSEIQKSIDKNKISIKANGKNYDIKLNDIILGYNTNELSNEIINYGKDENLFKKLNQIVMKKNIEFVYTFKINDSNIDKLVKDISYETNKAIKEPQAIINGNKISYKEGENGLKLDEQIFKSEINKALKQKDIVSGSINMEAKYKVDKPTIVMNDLKKADEKISIYSTTYSPGGGRGSNVENAARKLDDMIIMPGQEFSYEKAVGPVERNNGYTYAPVISNGEMVQGIGGGVCQVSSTLYNTMLKAGILPTERRNHSKAVNYVPRGLDATLASGSIDYKFKNTFEYPIVINTYCNGGKLTIEFWSNKEALKGIEYKPVSYASGKVANAYLYGYDKNGKKVYEKHIDTSVYR
ncbi:MAG: VanW family protein [Peptostreptococcaceae bacterium]